MSYTIAKETIDSLGRKVILSDGGDCYLVEANGAKQKIDRHWYSDLIAATIPGDDADYYTLHCNGLDILPTLTPSPERDKKVWVIDESVNPIKITAGKQKRKGYRNSKSDYSASGRLATLSADTGTISFNFEGNDGTYQITVRYLDENDGVSTLAITHNNRDELDSWALDAQTTSGVDHPDNYRERVVKDALELHQGDCFRITGRRGEGRELARVDQIIFQRLKLEDYVQTIIINNSN